MVCQSGNHVTDVSEGSAQFQVDAFAYITGAMSDKKFRLNFAC